MGDMDIATDDFLWYSVRSYTVAVRRIRYCGKRTGSVPCA